MHNYNKYTAQQRAFAESHNYKSASPPQQQKEGLGVYNSRLTKSTDIEAKNMGGIHSKSNIRISKNGRMQLAEHANGPQYGNMMHEQKERASSYGPIASIPTS